MGLRHVGLRPQPGLKHPGARLGAFCLRRLTFRRISLWGFWGFRVYGLVFRVQGFRVQGSRLYSGLCAKYLKGDVNLEHAHTHTHTHTRTETETAIYSWWSK